VESKNGFVDKGIDCYAIDEDYFKTLGMEIKKAGTSAAFQTHSEVSWSTRTWSKLLDGTNPLEKKLSSPGDTSGFYLEVVGVVKDFNQKSLYNPIAPLLLFYRPNNSSLQLKLEGKNIPGTIASIEKDMAVKFPRSSILLYFPRPGL
jgi:putative ABC transport system permease protein